MVERKKFRRGVSAVLLENIRYFHVFKSVKKIRSRVRKRLYVLRNTLSLIKMHAMEECLPRKLQNFNIFCLLFIMYNCVKQLQCTKLYEFLI